MTIDNPIRDTVNAMVEKLGFKVLNNSINSRRNGRNVQISCSAPKFTSVSERNAWKKEKTALLIDAGFVPEWGTSISRGFFNASTIIDNNNIPGYVAHEARKKAEHVLPESVSKYITDVLMESLDKVVAHRIVNGEEPKYAVLMRGGKELYTVVFVGKYKARRPLGPYEEATSGNAVLVRWDCLSDAEPWEFSEKRFMNAPENYFTG